MSQQANKIRYSNDAYVEHQLPEDYPLSTLDGYRSQIHVFDGPFDPTGNWKMQFGIHSVGTAAGRLGTLRIERKQEQNGCRFQIFHEKALTGTARSPWSPRWQARRILRASVVVPNGDDPLATPTRWQFSTQVFDTDGKEQTDLSLVRQCRVQDGTLVIKTGEQIRRIPLPGRYTIRWLLFDAVQRLPGSSFEPLKFTLLDHFDQPKPDHILYFRKQVTTDLDGKQVKLKVYDQLGRGVMPFGYFVDSAGRLVVVTTGLEAYILESAENTA